MEGLKIKVYERKQGGGGVFSKEIQLERFVYIPEYETIVWDNNTEVGLFGYRVDDARDPPFKRMLVSATVLKERRLSVPDSEEVRKYIEKVIAFEKEHKIHEKELASTEGLLSAIVEEATEGRTYG